MLKIPNNCHLSLNRIRKALPVADRSGQGGFTLIEILVSMLIFSVVMTAMMAFLWGVSSYWQKGKDMADINDNARSGLNRMTREIRQASVVTIADDTRIAFNADFGSGQENISYWFNAGSNGAAGSVWREDKLNGLGPQLVLFNNVNSMTFTFYGNDYKCDANQNGLVNFQEIMACGGDLQKIARVDISIGMKAGSSTQTFVDQAWLRNRLF